MVVMPRRHVGLVLMLPVAMPSRSSSQRKLGSILTLVLRLFGSDLKGNSFRTPAARGFISFGKRHCACDARANGEAGPKGERQRRESKKRTKEKRFSRQGELGERVFPGFSDSPSMARSENGGPPARRPTGLRVGGCLWSKTGKAYAHMAPHVVISSVARNLRDQMQISHCVRNDNCVGVASGNTSTAFPLENPEGGAHGCAPFSDRAMDGESENRDRPAHCGCALSRKALFFGSFL